MRLLPNAMAITMQSDTKLLSRAFRRLPNAVMSDKRLGPAARVIAAGATGKAGRIGYRKWFDGKLCVDDMAAYLYFRAGTGRRPTVFASELAKTFGWSRPTGPSHKGCPTMNYYVRLVRHTDSAWHDRFFTFVAAIFKGGGQTFSDWAARGGWGKGYDVFAMVVDDQVAGTVGRTTMRS